MDRLLLGCLLIGLYTMGVMVLGYMRGRKSGRADGYNKGYQDCLKYTKLND